MVVQHNLQAMNANRMLNVTTGQQAKSTEKLSSGYRINRAADDAAGLTISEKMRKQIKRSGSGVPSNSTGWCISSSDSRRCVNRSSLYVTENERVSSSVCKWNQCTV